MLSPQFLKKLTLTALLVASTSSLAKVVSAQSPFFYYPSASFFSPSASFFQSEDNPSLSTVIEEDKFATLNANLQATKLSDVINQEKNLTVLAPTEEAFAALSPELQEKLSQPGNLEKVLKYHLIMGEISEDDIKRREVSTLLKENSVAIGGVEGENKEVTAMFNDATASEPLFAENGTVIPIDKVLIPSSL